jgi:hypothetical protein
MIFLTADETNPADLLGYGTWELRAAGLTLGGSGGGGGPVTFEYFLIETGEFLLLESGSKLVMG